MKLLFRSDTLLTPKTKRNFPFINCRILAHLIYPTAAGLHFAGQGRVRKSSNLEIAQLDCHAPRSDKAVPFTIEMSIPPLHWLGSKTETLTMRHSRPQASKIAIATLFLVTAMVPSVAFGSKFSECKSSALTHYSAAVLEANPDNAKRAIIESTACDRFISELPREEQEKIRRFQEEMQKFQLDQSRIQNKT